MGYEYCGVNLAPLRDYSPSWAFVDRFKHCRKWVPFSVGTTEWGDSGVEFPADSNGYPLQIPYDDGGGWGPQQCKTLLFRDYSEYPAGDYTLIFEGTGEIKLEYDATGTYTTPDTNHTVTISTPSDQGVLLSIISSSVSDPIRNIRFIMPGYAATYQTQIFHPLFLERLSIFSVIRFGGWGNVWGNPTVDWSEVPTKTYYSQAATPSGVCPEHMIDLSNALGADPWIGVPYSANDTYVTSLATLIYNTLDVGRKLYIEYSNETWNGQMEDFWYCQENGIAAELDPNNTIAGMYWYARRSAEIFHIFETVFGGTSRLVRVVGGQAANSWLGGKVLEGLEDPVVNPTSSRADVMAIGPYFGNSVFDDIVTNGEVDTITVQQILDRMEAAVQEDTAAWTAAYYTLCQSYNIPLIAYEGGPHLVGTGENRTNVTLTAKCIEAARDSRMKTIMEGMFDEWFTNGGLTFVGYSFIDKYSDYGTFAMLERMDQEVSTAPKYLAYSEYFAGEIPSVGGGGMDITGTEYWIDEDLSTGANDGSSESDAFQTIAGAATALGTLSEDVVLRIKSSGTVDLARSLTAINVNGHVLNIVLQSGTVLKHTSAYGTVLYVDCSGDGTINVYNPKIIQGTNTYGLRVTFLGTVNIINPIGIGSGGVGHRSIYGTSGNPVNVYNGTFGNVRSGVFNSGAGVLTAKNCYAHGTDSAYLNSGAGSIVMETCASSDLTGSVGLQSIPYDNTTFTDVTPGAEDFTPADNSPLSGAGTITEFLYDFNGNLFATPRDIGAIAKTVATEIKIVFNTLLGGFFDMLGGLL